MNHIESLLSAEEEIKPYLAIFKACYERAIIKYNSIRDGFPEPMYNRAKAIIFHNIIVNEIKSEFTNMERVDIVEKYESISLVINNHISARFKKLNNKGFPVNHRSHRNDIIIGQQLLLGFVDYPPIARLDVGYNFDISGTKFELLKVICRKNNEILWDLYFHDMEMEENANQANLPIMPDTKTGDVSRVTPKEKKQDKNINDAP